MRRNTTIIAAAFLATCAMLNATAHAQVQTVDVFRVVPIDSKTDRSFNGVNVTIVILTATGEMQELPVACGAAGGTRPLYNAVVIDLSGPAVTPVQVAMETPLPAGTRLQNASADNLECCLTEDNAAVPCAAEDARFSVWVTSLEVVNPRNSSPLLFTSTATVTNDGIGVITGQQDEEGFADLVLTKRGQKPVFATIWTDDLLKPSGKIVDIIELDYDPETGIALYGGFVEY